MKKRKVFNQISKDIKTIKIQGARNIAKKALYAYSLIPTEDSIKKLIFLRIKFFCILILLKRK
ncbi:MAG: hypothetical protein QJ16_C0007G0059 [archaeon GW2011_AR1]|nr:MAG: hypothetical protein QJ16_C0007G0059 [archaeon GW2011_AR1]